MHMSCVRKVEEVAGAALSDQAVPGGAVWVWGTVHKERAGVQGARRQAWR